MALKLRNKISGDEIVIAGGTPSLQAPFTFTTSRTFAQDEYGTQITMSREDIIEPNEPRVTDYIRLGDGNLAVIIEVSIIAIRFVVINEHEVAGVSSVNEKTGDVILDSNDIEFHNGASVKDELQAIEGVQAYYIVDGEDFDGTLGDLEGDEEDWLITKSYADEHYQGGGGGAVSSVNGQTGDVVLTASDIDLQSGANLQDSFIELRDDYLEAKQDIDDLQDDVVILDSEIAEKQNALIAGSNITIDGDTISATGTVVGVADYLPNFEVGGVTAGELYTLFPDVGTYFIHILANTDNMPHGGAFNGYVTRSGIGLASKLTVVDEGGAFYVSNTFTNLPVWGTAYDHNHRIQQASMSGPINWVKLDSITQEEGGTTTFTNSTFQGWGISEGSTWMIHKYGDKIEGLIVDSLTHSLTHMVATFDDGVEYSQILIGASSADKLQRYKVNSFTDVEVLNTTFPVMGEYSIWCDSGTEGLPAYISPLDAIFGRCIKYSNATNLIKFILVDADGRTWETNAYGGDEGVALKWTDPEEIIYKPFISSNLKQTVDSGDYRCPTDNIAMQFVDSPEDVAFVMHVENFGHSDVYANYRCIQTLQPHNANRFWVRHQYGQNEWTEWRDLSFHRLTKIQVLDDENPVLAEVDKAAIDDLELENGETTVKSGFGSSSLGCPVDEIHFVLTVTKMVTVGSNVYMLVADVPSLGESYVATFDTFTDTTPNWRMGGSLGVTDGSWLDAPLTTVANRRVKQSGNNVEVSAVVSLNQPFVTGQNVAYLSLVTTPAVDLYFDVQCIETDYVTADDRIGFKLSPNGMVTTSKPTTVANNGRKYAIRINYIER
jgi:hypothetical protein